MGINYQMSVMPTISRKVGRPRQISDDQLRQVCALISTGLSLRKACESLGLAKTTVRERLLFSDNRDISDQYVRAVTMRIEVMVEEMLDIADDRSLDPNKARLMIDTRKWLASKILPKKYGDQKKCASEDNKVIVNVSMHPTRKPEMEQDSDARINPMRVQG